MDDDPFEILPFLVAQDNDKGVDIKVHDLICREDGQIAVVLALKRLCPMSGEFKTGLVTLDPDITLRLFLQKP